MRNRAVAIVTATLLTLLVTTSTFASDIYKWTDANGNVYYGDRPVGAQSERLAIESKPTDDANVQAMTQARAESRARQLEETANLAVDPAPEELRAAAEEQAKQCSTHKARLQKILTSSRIYRNDENGERVYLDESEMQETRERAESKVEEYCNQGQ